MTIINTRDATCGNEDEPGGRVRDINRAKPMPFVLAFAVEMSRIPSRGELN